MSVEEGRAERDAGMARALEAAHTEWKDAFRSAVDLQKVGKFTSEDITDIVGLPYGGIGQHRNNSVGSMMSGLAGGKSPVIIKTGHHVPSRNRSSHAAELTEWTGAENLLTVEKWRRETDESIRMERDQIAGILRQVRINVTKLHQPKGGPSGPKFCGSCKVPYPCRTLVALKGRP